MTHPKQIIYPMRYLRPFLCGTDETAVKFETEFGSLLGGDVRVVPLGRARGGVYLLAKIAIRGARRRVIMSPYTIPDVVNMVNFAGGEPVFVDNLPNSTNMDVDHLAMLLDETVACVILTHYHVNQNRIDDIRRLCKAAGAFLYDDSALAVGGEYGGAPIGTCTDASVFSLSGFKALNFLWGGAIATCSPEIFERVVEEVNSWPRLKAKDYKGQALRILKYDVATRPSVFARVVFPILKNKVLNDSRSELLQVSRLESESLDASILSRPSLGALQEWLGKLESVSPMIARRRSIAKVYDRFLSQFMISPETSAQVRAGSCFVNYPICVDSNRRSRIFKNIVARGFDVGLSLYPNVHEMRGFDRGAGRSRNVSALVRSTITLPTHPRISAEYAERLASAVADAIYRAESETRVALAAT